MGKIDDRLESVPDIFISGVGKLNDPLFSSLVAKLSRLSLEDSALVFSSENAIIANNIITEWIDEVLSKQFGYTEQIKSFLDEFEAQAALQTSNLGGAVGKSLDLDREFIQFAKRSTGEQLININSSIGEPVKDLINQGLISESEYEDLIEALKEQIIGLKGPKGGILTKHVSQIAYDSFATFHRGYTHRLNEKELGLEWYRYMGGISQGSRSFCKDRAGGYFHISEIQEWGTLPPWQGWAAGTNSSTIFVYLGGYNCQHNLLPVLEDVVPKSDLARIKR